MDDSVVIDMGSAWCRVGFAGDDRPSRRFRTTCCSGADGIVAGSAALDGTSPLEYAITRDDVKWDVVEALYDNAFRSIDRNPAECAVALSEQVRSPKDHAHKNLELMFEAFDSPGVLLSCDSVLALYSSGRTTGVAVQVGHAFANIVPVWEGYALSEGVKVIPRAGVEVNATMERLLRERGVLDPTHPIFMTSRGKEIIQHIKETVCYTPLKYEANMSIVDWDRLPPLPMQHEKPKSLKALCVDAIKEFPGVYPGLTQMRVPRTIRNDLWPVLCSEYTLPDGETILLGNERVRACEGLFRPSLFEQEGAGLPGLIKESIRKCPIDVRKDLGLNVALCGGTVRLPGFLERCRADLTPLLPSRSRVLECEHDSVWIGNSILGSLTNFGAAWISREEYMEDGPYLADRKKSIHVPVFN